MSEVPLYSLFSYHTHSVDLADGPLFMYRGTSHIRNTHPHRMTIGP